MLILSAIPVAIWGVLLFARGGFWRVSKQMAPRTMPPSQPKHVVAVIPARDEAQHIGKTVAALSNQRYSGRVDIIVVDDNSTDDTAAAARAHEGITVIRGRALQRGWTGKLWALSQGIDEALKLSPDYLLFTDADILHGPNSVEELVAIAEAQGLDLVSFMVKLQCETLAEQLLIPAFVFFFFMLYPPAWIRDQRRKTAGAAGGCVLIRPQALRRAGGIAAIANEVIDDCALARAVKQNGGRVWLGLTGDRWSERRYESFSEIGRMISRTAFNQLNHSPLLLIGTVAGLAITYVAPVGMLFDRRRRWFGITACGTMTAAYAPMVRFYGRPAIWALTLPFAALFYAGATVHSAVRYWSGRGGGWKGRLQDAS